jgi:hypothetical protein
MARNFLASWEIVKLSGKNLHLWWNPRFRNWGLCSYRLLLHLGNNNTITNCRIKKTIRGWKSPQFHGENPRFKWLFCSIIFPRMEMRHKLGSAYILQRKSPSTSWPRLNDLVLFIPRRCRLQVHYQTTEWRSMKTRFFLQRSVWRTPPQQPGLLPLRKPLFHAASCFVFECALTPPVSPGTQATTFSLHILSSSHNQRIIQRYVTKTADSAQINKQKHEMVPTEITTKT